MAYLLLPTRKGFSKMDKIRKLFAPKELGAENYEMTRKKFVTYLILVIPALTILLAACGGGGGSSDRKDH